MKSHFNFSKQERSGIFVLLLLIVILQLGYFGLKYFPYQSNTNVFKLDAENQSVYDSLVSASNNTKNIIKKVFNPNYISDFKGYTLGMSPTEMDRLQTFRKEGRYVNSASEFQQVTGISDSLLNEIIPLFKFPDWVQEKAKTKSEISKEKSAAKAIQDINTVSADDLRQISGIGEKLSARIVKFRDRLGGFLVDEQLYDVYGLEPVVVERALRQFQVLNPPNIEKINVNTASTKEIASLVYIEYHVAQNIVLYREANGPYKSTKELFNVSDFPINRIDRIALYLSF